MKENRTHRTVSFRELTHWEETQNILGKYSSILSLSEMLSKQIHAFVKAIISQKKPLRDYIMSKQMSFVNQLYSLTISYIPTMHSSYYYLPHSFNSFSLSSTSQFCVTVSFPHSHLSLLFCDPLISTRVISTTSSMELSTGVLQWTHQWNYPQTSIGSTSGRDRVPRNPPCV